MKKMPARQLDLSLTTSSTPMSVPKAVISEATVLLQQLLLTVHQASRETLPAAPTKETSDEQDL